MLRSIKSFPISYHSRDFGSISWHDWYERECKERRSRTDERALWLRNDITYGLVVEERHVSALEGEYDTVGAHFVIVSRRLEF